MTPIRRYSRGRKLVAMRDVEAGLSRYYHYDHQGTTQCLTDGAGGVADRFASDAWGVPVKRTGSSINRQWYIGGLGYYTGQLQYVRARYLNSLLGQWRSHDRLPTERPYDYVDNSPGTMVDPSGLVPPRPKYGCSGTIAINQEYPACNHNLFVMKVNKVFRATAYVTCYYDTSETCCCPSSPVILCQDVAGLFTTKTRTFINIPPFGGPWCPDWVGNLRNRPLTLGNCDRTGFGASNHQERLVSQSVSPEGRTLACGWELCTLDAPGISSGRGLGASTCFKNFNGFDNDQLHWVLRVDIPLTVDLFFKLFVCDASTGAPIAGIQPHYWEFHARRGGMRGEKCW